MLYYRPQRSCEGYVFTGVCHSVHRGDIPACIAGGIPAYLAVGDGILACIAGGIPACLVAGGVLSQHALQQGGACSWGGCLLPGGACSGGVCSQGVWRPPRSRRLLLRTVRILLECILVHNGVLVYFTHLAD